MLPLIHNGGCGSCAGFGSNRSPSKDKSWPSNFGNGCVHKACMAAGYGANQRPFPQSQQVSAGQTVVDLRFDAVSSGGFVADTMACKLDSLTGRVMTIAPQHDRTAMSLAFNRSFEAPRSCCFERPLLSANVLNRPGTPGRVAHWPCASAVARHIELAKSARARPSRRSSV